MFTSKASTKLRWLLSMGLALLLLMTFLSCSQDAIVDPRNDEEEDGGKTGDEDPNEGGGGGLSLLETPAGGEQLFLG